MTHPTLLGVLDGIRSMLRQRIGVTLALSAAAVLGAVLVCAWVLAGPDGWRPGTPVPLLLVLGGAVAVLGIAIGIVNRLARWTAESGMSAEIERFAQLPEGSVRAQAELLRAVPPGTSSSLARAGERTLLARIAGSLSQLAGVPGLRTGRWIRIAGGFTVVLAVLVALLFALTPDRSRMAWAGLATPGSLLRPVPLPALELQPGDARLPRGSSPQVSILAGGRDSVTVHWQETGEVVRERRLAVSEASASTELPPLRGEVRYWATAPDGARTAEYQLEPVDPSLLVDLLIEAQYPPHTRIAPEQFLGSPESLVLPEGTTLTLRGSVDGVGEAVSLVGEDEETLVQLEMDAGRFSGSWQPNRSEQVAWVVSGGTEGAFLPPPIDVEIVPDALPVLAFPIPGADGDLPLSLRVPLLVEATDDYGVAWIELESVLRVNDGSLGTPVVDRVETGNQTTVTLRSILDFSDWEILPGEEVLLRARVRDNAPFARIVESRLYSLRMPLPAELRESVRERIDEAASRTEEILERAEREAADIRAMERQEFLERTQPSSATAPRDDFAEREELREALERQAELAREVDEVRESLDEAREALPEEERVEAEMRDRIAELEEILEDVLGPEARERLEELLEMLRQGEMPPETPGEILGEMSERQEQMQSRLEMALERLRRTALEESMAGAEEELRALSEMQQEVADSLAAGEGADTQEEVARRTEALEEQVANLEDRLREGGDEQAADGVQESRERLAEAREAMEQAAEQSGAGNDAEAGQQAEQAAEQLEQAAQEMQETQSDFADEGDQGADEALQRGAQSALALARRQGEVREAFVNAGPIRRSEFEGEEIALNEGLRNLATELAAATAGNPELGEQISATIGSAMQAVDRTLDGLRRSETVPPGTDTQAAAAQRAMQEVALLALSGLSGEAQGAPAAAGASAEDVLAELEAMAQAQQSINRDARALGQDPGADGITARIEELARTQEAIASRLGELSREPGAGELPGSLEALGEEAEELADLLGGGRLEAATIDRQDQFLERLLSAGRTLERDGPTEEREGTTAGAFERRVVSPLPDYLLEALSLPLPPANELDALTPGQRRLVLDYFERVNRRQSGVELP
ncbi:MAG: hypothetical protein WD056_01985 [Gemmatimonadota bacterium]